MKTNLWVVILISMLAIIMPCGAVPSGYNYMQSHVLQGSNSWSTNTSVVVPFEVYNQVGTSTGNIIYLNGHSSNFPYDVLFTDDNNNIFSRQVITISNASTSTYAQIFVNIPSIAKTGNTTINIYYGNSAVTTSPDNGDTTFLAWEDGSSLYNSLYPFNKYSGNPIISNGTAEPNLVHNTSTNQYWIFTNNISTGGILKYSSSAEMGPYTLQSVVVPAPAIYSGIQENTPIGTMLVYNTNTSLIAINLSTSNDGSTFTSRGKVLTTSAGSWDSTYVYDSTPYYDNVSSTYFLIYAGRNSSSVNGNAFIGYATSPSGLPGSFTKQGVLINVGPIGSFDSMGVFDPKTVIQYDPTDLNRILITYTGYDGTRQTTGMATATIAGGLITNITKSASNPIQWYSESYETPVGSSLYGPNEPMFILDDNIYKGVYRANVSSGTIGYLNFTQDNSTKLPAVAHKPRGYTIPTGTWMGGGFLNQTDNYEENHLQFLLFQILQRGR